MPRERKPQCGATNRGLGLSRSKDGNPRPQRPRATTAKLLLGSEDLLHPTSPQPLNAKSGDAKFSDTIGAVSEDRAQRRLSNNPASPPRSPTKSGHEHHSLRRGDQSLNGHSEYVMQVMRDFFQSRPAEALIDVFRDQDTNASGTLEFDEFRNAIRLLNITMTEKDMQALFRLADVDGSGCLEFDEFFNNFRKDGYETIAKGKREAFFWGKTRPRSLLAHDDRVKLREQVFGMSTAHRTKEELLEVIREQLEPSVAQRIFDDGPDARLTVKEFAIAMKDLQVDVTEAQAQDLIAELNRRNHSQMQSFIGPSAFVKAFEDRVDDTPCTSSPKRSPRRLQPLSGMKALQEDTSTTLGSVMGSDTNDFQTIMVRIAYLASLERMHTTRDPAAIACNCHPLRDRPHHVCFRSKQPHLAAVLSRHAHRTRYPPRRFADVHLQK